MELDADPFLLDGSSMLDDVSGLDVVVGSTHVFPGGSAFWFDRVRLPEETARRVAKEWREWTIKFVRSGKIHVLAHPGDLVAARRLLPPFDEPEVLDFFDPLFEAMAEVGVAFELNELLSRKLPVGHFDSYPALVRRAHSHGLLFSLGSDAHRPEDVAQYEWLPALVDAVGLTTSDLWYPEALRKS
ncbi:MAG: hypothetical protein M5U26_13460 [Planctomycetota bacterium]|nr:hypothetical protein [Planctomycetota bacterium]